MGDGRRWVHGRRARIAVQFLVPLAAGMAGRNRAPGHQPGLVR